MASMAGMQSPPPAHQAALAAANAQYAAYMSHAQQQVYQQAAQSGRPGTLPPGVGLKIGEHEVVIERFLSEGGFAHVYLVQSSRPIPSPTASSDTQHVLKRVAVPDKETLKEVRWEVDVMKLLRGHKHIVNLIEASASPIPGTAGYEVFILMEYCSGGGIIDMMNTRLQNRLTEAEILKIFSDVVEAVCWMHSKNPPIMHRDLKVENILLAGPEFYKVCDFGSSTTPKRAPQSMPEIQILEAELNKHTTLQYRAPEMCDVWSRKEVGLPADVWALGVLLYKLCFYTTPFEEQGPLAILNVQYKMPSYPNYSQELRSLIASTLVEPIKQRPTAWQVHQEVSRLRGVSANRSYNVSSDVHQSPSTTSLNGAVSPSFTSRPTTGLDQVLGAPKSQNNQAQFAFSQEAAGISPMRRGRPGKHGQGPSVSLSSGSAAAANASEWQVPSRDNGTPQPSSAASSSGFGKLPPAAMSPAQSGFADSFAPMASAPVQSPNPDSAASKVQESKTAAATAALWEEMANPGSTKRAQPTLASLAAARSGQPPPPSIQHVPSPMLQQQRYNMQQYAQPSSKPLPSPSTSDLRRVSPGKPLGPRPSLSPSTSRSGAVSAPADVPEVPESHIASSAPPQRDSARPAPPALKPKPKLVSRGSQTSPALMDSEWRQRRENELRSQQLSTPSTTAPSAPLASPKLEEKVDNSTAAAGGEPQRFPSIDEWESTGFSPPPVSAPPRQDRQRSSSYAKSTVFAPAKQPSRDLLGDDPGGLEGEATQEVASNSAREDSKARQTSASSAKSQNGETIAQRTIVTSPTPMQTPASQASILNGDRPKSIAPDGRPAAEDEVATTGEPFAATNGDSSEDDTGGPEDATGGSYGRPASIIARQRIDSLPSSGSVAPSSQNAPSRGPPIVAPKPTSGGIASVVSRYESISSGSGLEDGRQRSNSSTSNRVPSIEKPLKPTKPSSMGGRKRNDSLNSASGSIAETSPADDFNARFPDINGESSVSAASPSFGSRVHSNATSPSLGSSGVRARPQSMHLSPSMGTTTGPSLVRGSSFEKTAEPVREEENEDDDELKGVSSLKDRWQKKIQDQQQQGSGPGQNSTAGGGLGRRTSTLGNRWNRP